MLERYELYAFILHDLFDKLNDHYNLHYSIMQAETATLMVPDLPPRLGVATKKRPHGLEADTLIPLTQPLADDDLVSIPVSASELLMGELSDKTELLRSVLSQSQTARHSIHSITSQCRK